VADVIVERELNPPVTSQEFPSMAKQGTECLSLYGIKWVESYLSADGKRLVCHFVSPDRETTCMAIRQTGSEFSAAWPGTLHDGAASEELPNVMVTRCFNDPVALDDIQAIEDAGQGCLEMRNVTFIKTLFSVDRKRMMCLYRAPDAEAVRDAQREAGMPVDQIWACQQMTPAMLPQS
jgi:Nickel responsive protein SCO4226-like